jgi:general secretion pathway protein B
MSYILDALKKSEFERQQHAVPKINTMPVIIDSGQGESRAARLYFGLGALAVVAAIAVLALWRPWQGGPAETAIAMGPAVVQPATSPAAPAPAAARAEPIAQEGKAGNLPPSPEPATLPMSAAPAEPKTASARPFPPDDRGSRPATSLAREPETAKIAKAAPAAAVDQSSASKSSGANKRVTPVQGHIPSPADSQRSNPGADVAPPVAPAPAAAPAVERPPKRVLDYSELPASVQKSVPRLTVSGYSYAEEQEMRMAVINERVLREGDEVSPGVTLERIGSDGAVLKFKGFRFRP